MSEPVRWIKAEAILELELVDGNMLAQLVGNGVVDSKTKKNYAGEEVVYLKEVDVLRAVRGQALKPNTGIKGHAKNLAHDSFVASVASAVSAFAVGNWLADYGPDDWERQVNDAIARLEEDVADWRIRKREVKVVGGSLPYDGPPFKSFSIQETSCVMAPAIDAIAEVADISLGHKRDPDPMPSILPRLQCQFRWSDSLVRRVLFSDQGYPNLDFRSSHGSLRRFGSVSDYFERQKFYRRKFIFEVFFRKTPFLQSLETNQFVDVYHQRYCEIVHVDTSQVAANEDLKCMFYWNMLVLHAAFEELSKDG